MSSIAITGGATGTGVFSLLAPSTSTNRTINLPDSNGTILTTATAGVPVNGPAFSAYANSGTSLSTATSTKILFAIEEFDTNSNFTSSRFTPTVAGYYQLNACVRIPFAGAGEVQCSLYKNGSEYKRGFNLNGVIFTSGLAGCNINTIVFMNGSTDYVELFGYQNSGSTQTTGTDSLSWFNGAMVRSAV